MRLCEDGSYNMTPFGNGRPSFRAKSKAKPKGTSRENAMLKLIDTSDAFRRASQDLTARPVTWFNLSLVYETIKRIVTGEPQSNHEPLLARGWLTKDEADRFYDTMQQPRHGHPQVELKDMALGEAEALMRRVFNSLADELSDGRLVSREAEVRAKILHKLSERKRRRSVTPAE